MTLETMLSAAGEWGCTREVGGEWRVTLNGVMSNPHYSFCGSAVHALDVYAKGVITKYPWVKWAAVAGYATDDPVDVHWQLEMPGGKTIVSDKESLREACEAVKPKPSPIPIKAILGNDTAVSDTLRVDVGGVIRAVVGYKRYDGGNIVLKVE